MNILLTDATDIYGGGEEYVLTLATAFLRSGHVIGIAALPGHLLLERCARVGIDALPVNFTGMHRVFSVGMELAEIIRSRRVDIIHSNANYDRTCASLASRLTGKPHVTTVHSAHSILHNVTHWLRNRFGTDHFVAVAEQVRKILIHTDNIPSDRISCIPNGVLDNSVDAAARRRTIRSLINADDSTCVVGNVGRLVPFKGQTILIEAIAPLMRRQQNFLLVILGEGELRDKLENQARALGVKDRILMPGFVHNPRDWYHGFDVYCQPSLDLAEEAFPLAVLDGLSTGLPIIGTRVGGIPSMVNDGTNGYLVQPQDAGALTDAIATLSGDPGLRVTMSGASRLLFEQKYDAHTMVKRVEEVYRMVLRQ